MIIRKAIFLSLVMPASFGTLNLLAQSPDTLNEIAVSGSSIPELDLSRSSILSADQVNDRQIGNLVDLSALSPNLHINNNSIQSYGDIVAIRGIANTQLFGPAGVQLYVDGVPQADVSSYSSTLYDIESIEILRGSQGHKFGKSVSGGAINIKTQKPTEIQVHKISASYGTFDTQKYNINSSGPLDDGFSYSLALQRALSDGYINNTSGNADTSETWHGSLRFSVDRGSGTKIGFGANFENHELGAQPLVLRDGGDFYSRATDFEELTEIDRNQLFLTFEHELEDYSFFSMTNRNDWSMNPNRVDLDMSTATAATSVIIQDQIEWTQEIRIESQEGSETDWILGAFYADNESEGDATRWFLTGFPAPFDQDRQTTSYLIESENIGLFAWMGKNLTDKDYFSLGLRFDEYDKKMTRNKTSQLAAPSNITSTSDFSVFSPSTQWQHTFNQQITGLARITYSEKPGGFSAYTDTMPTFAEEETLAYEISLLLNPSKSWGLNITAYLNEIENYQFELPDALDPTNYYVANAEEATARGIEIEGYVKPSDNFTFSLAYGLCDSKYDKFDGSGLVGKQVSFIPKHTLACSINYRFDNGLHGQLGTKTIGDTYYWKHAGDNPTDKIDSYTLLDATLGYDWKDWEFSLFGLNLTDEEYYMSLVNNLPGTPGIAGSPRVIGLSVSKEF
ncbi:MAG: TonB-dependent receptor [Opitutae bacterium]